MRSCRTTRRIACALLLAAAANQACLGEVSAQSADAIRQLVTHLNAPKFAVRESAMQKLRTLVLEEDGGASVADELDRISLDPQLSFETHERLAEILRGVSRADDAPRERLTGEQTQSLVKQLCDDRFSARQNATRRLQWLLGNQENIVPLMLALKTRLGDAAAPPATRQALVRQYDHVRRAWLLAPAEKCTLPPITDEQIERWVKTIAQPIENESIFAAQQVAARELEDALVRDDSCDRATSALQTQLAKLVGDEDEPRVQVAKPLEVPPRQPKQNEEGFNEPNPPVKPVEVPPNRVEDPAAVARLRELVDFTRPAMVAEIWSATRIVNWMGGVFVAQADPLSVRLATMQYLHVGVPQIPAGAPRATHFDHCDDKRAHCVSGNTLLPGDYPVGSAFPHPEEGEATLFYLVNLPTPRRRLIYEFSARRDEALRLRELSERTCGAFLSQQRKLSEADAVVLMLLDRAVVSNFTGKFFSKIDDAALTGGLGNRLLIGRTSKHGVVCYALAFGGTKDAAPALIKAIADKRILPPDATAPYNLPLIALLSIARRDPWEKVNDWLSAQLLREESLIENVDPGPEVAATAAAILADRLGQSPQALGLVPVGDGFFNQIGLNAYRFADAERRAAARDLLRKVRPEITSP